jgi:hypothetical protein
MVCMHLSCLTCLLLLLVPGESLQAATIPGTRIHVEPTLLPPNGATEVTATLSGGVRFYPGASPPAFRVHLTQNGQRLKTIAPRSVSSTRLIFQFPPLSSGYYGFLVQVQGTPGEWTDVYASSPRFFKVANPGTDLSRSGIFETYPEGFLPSTGQNASNFLETKPYAATGSITGRVAILEHAGASIVNFEEADDYCIGVWEFEVCDEGALIFKVDVGFDGTAFVDFNIPFQLTFDFPMQVAPCQTIGFYVPISYPGLDRLNVEHTFEYSTTHRVGVNVPFDALPAFDITLQQLPDKLLISGQVPMAPFLPALSFDGLEIGGPFADGEAEYGGVRMRLGGQAQWASASSGNGTDFPTGTHQVPPTARTDLRELWFVGGDQIEFLAAAPIPYVQEAAIGLSAAQVKLYQDFQLNAENRDWIDLLPAYPYCEVTIPEGTPLGFTNMHQTITFTNDFYVLSEFIYRLGGGFRCDLPFVGSKQLMSWDILDAVAGNFAHNEFSATTQVTVDLPVEVISRPDYAGAYLASPGSVPHCDLTPLFHVANFTPEAAAQEQERRTKRTYEKPVAPVLVPGRRLTNFTFRTERAHLLVLSNTPSLGGTIATDPPPVMKLYTNGQIVGLTAKPALGYRFTGWSNHLTGPINPAVITMDNDKLVSANFEIVLPPVALTNPSFEADIFSVKPGYIKDNGPITGWSAEAYMGINPVAPFDLESDYFTDNGAIPDGRQAAFLQQDGALKQTVKALVPGAKYRVEFWENGRRWGYGGTNDAPTLEVRMDATVILASHAVPPRQGYLPRQTQPFVATANQMELAFVKTGPLGLDRTVLIDNVRVICCGLPPSISATLRGVELTLSWDTSATGFTLEATPSLTPPLLWTPVPGVASNQITLPVEGTTRFYRLRE